MKRRAIPCGREYGDVFAHCTGFNATHAFRAQSHQPPDLAQTLLFAAVAEIEAVGEYFTFPFVEDAHRFTQAVMSFVLPNLVAWVGQILVNQHFFQTGSVIIAE